MNILDIFMEGPNTGACLFQDGRLIAMPEEERFIRVKMVSEVFPSNAIRFCLKQAGIELTDLACVATANAVFHAASPRPSGSCYCAKWSFDRR